MNLMVSSSPLDLEIAGRDAAGDSMPLPNDSKTIYLAGLFFLVFLTALHAAAEIVWPFVFAFMLSLLLKPVQRVLERLHIPRLISAFLLVLAVLAVVVALVTAVSGPAATWAAKLPDGVPKLLERLRFLEAPLLALQAFWEKIETFAGWKEGASSTGTALLGSLFTGARGLASGFLTTLLYLFFLLVAGEIFLQRLVEIMPRFSNKRQVVEIAQQTETDISAYLVTITGLNA